MAVKPSAQPTLVRTQHLPPRPETIPDQFQCGRGLAMWASGSCQAHAARCRQTRPYAASRGIYVGWIPVDQAHVRPGREVPSLNWSRSAGLIVSGVATACGCPAWPACDRPSVPVIDRPGALVLARSGTLSGLTASPSDDRGLGPRLDSRRSLRRTAPGVSGSRPMKITCSESTIPTIG